MPKLSEALDTSRPLYGFYPHLNPKVANKPDTLNTPEHRSALAETLLSMAPGSGEALSLRDSWNASGKAGDALLVGEYGKAASEYGNLATALLGSLPGAGVVARGTKRGAAWMDRNMPSWLNRGLDAAMPSDPKSTLNIFAGPTAKTADAQALTKAQEMASSGASRDDIWRDTGWFQGADGKWRFEIDDSKAFYRGSKAAGSSQAEDVFLHPELYQAYPSLGSAKVLETGSATEAPSGAWYNLGAAQSRMELSGRGKGSSALHEMQHGVQDIEGFSPGANPDFGHAKEDVAKAARAAYEDSASQSDEIDDILRELGVDIPSSAPKSPPKPWDEMSSRERLGWHQRGRERLYYRAPGEQEARNVQMRQNLTPEQRRDKAPWLTQDFPF